MGDGPGSAVSVSTRWRSPDARFFGEPHRRVRIAVVLQLVERRFAARLHQRPIQRLPRLQRQPRHPGALKWSAGRGSKP